MTEPLLSVEHLEHCHANGRRLELPLAFELYPGQAVLLTGPSGSGKSTFLRALGNCLPEGSQSRWQARKLPVRSRLALQDPDAQLLCTTVEEEIALGLRNLALPAEEIARRVDEQLTLHELLPLRDRSLQMLSMGQKHRVLLAALLAMHPTVLLLDEPFSQLDVSGEAQLRQCIARLKSSGCAVVVAQHHGDPDDPLWDLQLAMPPVSHAHLSPRHLPISQPFVDISASATFEPVLVAERLCCHAASTDPVLDNLDFALHPGETVHILGQNAAGKSTLLHLLAAGRQPQSGVVRFHGAPVATPAQLIGKVLLLPQRSDMMLFEETVAREVGFSLRRQSNARGRIDEALSLCGLTEFANEPPLCLSYGERHLVGLASLLAAGPEVLLLDEPLTGLDDGLARHVLRVLDYYAFVQRMAILLVSHAPLPAPWGQRRLILSQGRLHDA